MSRAENKTERLLQMEALLLTNPQGITQAEMARRLGVDRSVIHRNLYDFQKIYPTINHEDGRISLDRSAYLVKVAFTLHEATAVHLAARLLATRMDRQNPHAASALRKLGVALEQLAPRISNHVKQAAEVMDNALQWQDPRYLQVLEKLTLAWAELRRVRVWHRSEKAGKVLEYLLGPYFIEPYAVGQTTHLIAQDEKSGKLRTLKIERIERIELTSDYYQIPTDFDPRDLLADAWGIWYTNSAPIEVVLKFSPSVAARLEETRWHRSEKKTRLEDGSVLWQAKVAEPLEMIPWIRSWGADVEALEPSGLRQALAREARELASVYGVMKVEIKPYSFFWAKADRKDQAKIHRLIYHLIDVGQVALAMWKNALDVETKRQLSQWFGGNEESTGQTLAFLASLHDLGKASPDFQIKNLSAAQEVAQAGFDFPKLKSPNPTAHGAVSAKALKDLLQSEINLSKFDAKSLAQAVGGHHGAWIHPFDWQAVYTDNIGGAEWETARKEMLLAMRKVFNPQTGFALPENNYQRNACLTVFSGFVSVVDWIGSMTEFFPYEKDVHITLEEYASRAATNAENALAELGWFNWQADGTKLGFTEMFPFINTPNTFQQKVVDEAEKVTLPAFLILETPTGSGKTEAALYAADTWLQSQRGRGMYIAMPTQATSNQMYQRTKEFLLRRYPDEGNLNFHLVHGGALLEDGEKTENIYDEDEKDFQGGIRAEAWFLPRKRTLLAPFGVGTVDQALLSVLQTRHFFVRMFGLQNKVVIFDEVHAYDTYMSELFKRLLAWLKQIGVSVVLLSATLPESTRRELLAAYLGDKEVELLPAAYPRLTIASALGVQSIALEAPSSRTIILEQCDTQPQIIVENLRTALQHGGCAAVICNRVKRTQELYKEIQAAGLVPEEDLILFHARFPFAWREEIEKTVLSKFGKRKNNDQNSSRPAKSIVVATQVIEQSLDLDFDFMISDLAPIDLLIQRAGRLHRHGQNDPIRPEYLKIPRLVIAYPQTNEIPEFGNDEYVYDRSVMLKTWLELKDKSTIILPQETTALIEAVYGDVLVKDEILRNEIEDAIEKAKQKECKAVFNAITQLIYEPDEEDLLDRRNNALDEDNPAINVAFRAMTRDAEPGITLICLHRVENSLRLSPDDPHSIVDVTEKPDKELTKKLLRNSLNLQNFAIVKYFGEQEPELKWKGWKEAAALKHCVPIVFDNGRCHLPNSKHVLILDRHLGLFIHKEEQ